MKLGFLLCRERDDLTWYHPLGLGYLASYLKAQKLDLEIFIVNDVEELIGREPDVAGVSCSSAAYGRAVRDAARIRSRLDVPIIIGGVHISTCPESMNPVFDLAVIGEGEHTLTEVMRLYSRKGALEPDDLASIDGLAWLEQGKLVRTQEREPIQPLDLIPPPDRELLGYRGGPAHIMTSRGCPYKCAFCSSSAFWSSYRSFSAKRVAEELKDLVDRYGTREVHIYDDLFTADRKRLEEIRKEMDELGLLGRISLSCAVRANVTDVSLANLLKEIGIRRLTFGAESNSEKVLQFLKQNISPEQNQLSVDNAYDAGIDVGLSFIVGVPGEDRGDVLETYRFIGRNLLQKKIDQADVNLLVPMPSTEIWKIALERGLVSAGMDWDRLRSPWDGLVLEDSFIEHGREYFRWDRIVRRMLGLFGRPVLGLAPFSVAGRDTVSEVSSKERIVDSFYLITPESRLPDVRGGDFFSVVTCSIDDWCHTTDDLLQNKREALVVAARSGEALVRDTSLTNGMVWTAHLGGLDLLRHDGMAVFSTEALGRIKYPSPERLIDHIEQMDTTGLKVSDFDPSKSIDPFSPENLESSPDGAATLSDLLSAYADGFLERQRALNVESGLRSRIAELESLKEGTEG